MGSKKLITSVLVLLLIGAAGAAAYFYQQMMLLKQDPNVVARQEVTSTIASVGRLIELPKGETPTIATITDPTKLKDQPFFANAKAGDKLLLYTTAKKAYLYDPVNNRLVEVAPLTIGPSVPSPSATSTSSSRSSSR